MNETEASTVRLIFRSYAELGSVSLLRAELDFGEGRENNIGHRSLVLATNDFADVRDRE